MANELTVEQHMEMISSMVLHLLKKTVEDNGLNEKAFLGVSIASEGLDDALHLPFKKMDYYSGDYIINVLQNIGQSSRDVTGRLSRKVCYYFKDIYSIFAFRWISPSAHDNQTCRFQLSGEGSTPLSFCLLFSMLFLFVCFIILYE